MFCSLSSAPSSPFCPHGEEKSLLFMDAVRNLVVKRGTVQIPQYSSQSCRKYFIFDFTKALQWTKTLGWYNEPPWSNGWGLVHHSDSFSVCVCVCVRACAYQHNESHVNQIECCLPACAAVVSAHRSTAWETSQSNACVCACVCACFM